MQFPALMEFPRELSPFESENADFRPGAKPGKDSCLTQAGIHIQPLASIFVQAVAFIEDISARSPSENLQLHRVGVARQRQVHVGFSDYARTPYVWVVVEQYLEVCRRASLQRRVESSADFGSPGGPLPAYQGQSAVFPFNVNPFVFKLKILR